MSLLLLFGFFSLCFDVHMKLCLLFCREVGAFVRPVVRLPAVVAMGVTRSIDALGARSPRLVP